MLRKYELKYVEINIFFSLQSEATQGHSGIELSPGRKYYISVFKNTGIIMAN